MPSYKQIGVPELVSGASNSSDLAVAVKNRILGIPATTPQSSFVAVIVTAWRSLSAACASMIDTVNRKVTTSDDLDVIAALNTAAAAGAHTVTFTATEPVELSSLWTIDNVAKLETIFGEDEATLLQLSQFADKRSFEAAMNTLVNKLGALNKNAIITADQDAGTIKIGTFANDGALTTAANTARAVAVGDAAAAKVTMLIPTPSVESSSGPNFGL